MKIDRREDYRFGKYRVRHRSIAWYAMSLFEAILAVTFLVVCGKLGGI